MKRLLRKVDSLLSKEVTLAQFAASFLAVMTIRLFIEQFIAKAPKFSFFEILVEFTHNILFFGIAIVLIWLYLSGILKIKPKNLAGLFLFALLLIIIPPILDILKTGGGVYWSFYILSDPATLWMQFASVFGHLPSGIVYFGTKIVFILAIIALSGFAWIKTKSPIKTFLTLLGTYILLFFMGAFPSLFYYLWALMGPKSIVGIKAHEIAQFFGSPGVIWGLNYPSLSFAFAYKLGLIYYPVLIFLIFALFLWTNRVKTLAVIKNARYPQLVYHSGLLFMGIGLGILAFPANFTLNVFSFFAVATLLIGVWLAWVASVFINDIYDIEIDNITNTNRPIQKKIFTINEYWQAGIFIFILSLLSGLVLGPPFLVIFLVYQFLAWIYSAKPYRLKRFPGVASFVSACASVLVLFAGFILVSPDQDIYNLSPRIIFLLLIAYTICIPIKDFKDLAGDKADGVLTVPVILGEQKGKLLIGINFFISYMLSVFFLNEYGLFFWALIFGAATFLAVTSKKIRPTEIFWWVLGLAGVYGLILVKVVFIK